MVMVPYALLSTQFDSPDPSVACGVFSTAPPVVWCGGFGLFNPPRPTVVWRWVWGYLTPPSPPLCGVVWCGVGLFNPPRPPVVE